LILCGFGVKLNYDMVSNNRENSANKRGMVRLLYGDDGFRLRERLKFYTSAFIKQYDPQGLSVARFFAPDFSVKELHREVASPPLFASKRLFVIYNFSKIKIDEGDAEIMLKDIKNLRDNSIIFAEEIDDKTFKKETFYKKIKLDGTEFFPQLKGMALEGDVRKRFEEAGYEIEPSALNKFVYFCGSDFWNIYSEMKKLFSYSDHLKKKTVSIADVEAVTLADLAENCFLLIDYFMAKDKKGVLRELRRLEYSGVGKETIFYQISSQFRQLLEIKALAAEKKINSSMVAETFGIHPFRAQKIFQASGNFTLEELKNAHNLLLETDYKIKSGEMKSELAVDLLLTKLLI